MNPFLYSLILLALFNFEQHKAPVPEADLKTEIRKEAPQAARSDQKFKASGHIWYTQAYCGGAAPPDDMLARLATPKPHRGMTVMVRTGSDNAEPATDSVFTSVTDSTGYWELSLPPGDYCMLLAPKNPRSNEMVHPGGSFIMVMGDCYEKWLSECDRSFRIEATNIDTLDFTIHGACYGLGRDPCSSYEGPLPSSAPRGR